MSFPKSPFAMAISIAISAGTAHAATNVEFGAPINISLPEAAAPGAALGTGANKSKLFRHRDGTLVAVYGDFVSPPAVGVDDENPFLVYDLKGQKERAPRDQFVRTCKPGELIDPLDLESPVKDCNTESHWTAPVNISKSATLSSISANWRGDGELRTVWGDVEKPNGFINPEGVTVVSWVSAYCPGGEQRARMYVERDFRTIPFTCTWVAYSRDKGLTWEDPVQLSSGERAAKQDVNRATQNGWMVTWQEDPTGLELGEAEGPGDGASGANVTGGTDIWYSRVASRPTDTPWVWLPAVRLTDNYEGKSGTPGSLPSVYDVAGNPVDDDDIEKGSSGASRANLGAVGNTAIVAWEETKGSGGLDEGKFIRYLSFPFNTPLQVAADFGDGPQDIGVPGCLISDPTKNARRVRFVTQSSTEAGAGGIQIGIFWKEGITSQGGPSDIMVRRGIYDGGVDTVAGLKTSNFVPAVDPACSTSVYAETQELAHEPADNLTSRTKLVASQGIDNLADDTELQFTENALAHRGLLRGRDLWVGYSYTENLALLTYLNADNYNFWIRRFNADTGTWARPKKVSDITDTTVNLREPRLVGTPPSGPACDAINDPTGPDCRNADVFFVAWGTQTNVSPWSPEQPEELGLFITRTSDGGDSFTPVTQLSVAQGIGGDISEDEESERAFESQLQSRPDGNQLFAIWNQDVDENTAHATFASAEVVETATSSSSGGCAYRADARADWTLLGLLGASLLAMGWRRRQTS